MPIPEAYRLGEWDFYNITLKITPDVLIPRPDTEHLVDVALEYLESRKSPCKILDLCCGSGCIGLAIEANCKDVSAVYADISPAALSVAKNNGCCDIRVIDALKFPPPELHSAFDVLAVNPPYVAQSDKALEESVFIWEPHLALFGGQDGLDFYHALFSNWLTVLKSGGMFAFEMGYKQSADVQNIAAKYNLDVNIRKDYAGIDRVIYGKKGNI